MNKIAARHNPPGRSYILAVAVFAVYIFFMVRHAIPDIWTNIYCVYYVCLAPVLIAFTLYHRRLNETPEIKIILFFWAWVYVSRLLNGDIYLMQDADLVLNTGMIYVLLVICSEIKGKARERFLDWMAIVTVLFFSLAAVVCLYAVLFRKEMYNPLTGDIMCGFIDKFRLTVFGLNPNTCCMWFFLSFFFLVYLFFRKANLLWRLIIIPVAFLNYLILAMTFSRNAMLAFSFCIGLLVLSLLLRRFISATPIKKILLTVFVLAVTVPLAYMSFSATGTAMNKISLALVQEQSDSDESATEAVSGTTVANEGDNPISEEANVYIDDRGFDDSGRLEIFKSIVYTMQQEPARLLRGCLCLNVMDIANTILPKWKPHYHNTFLQLFCLTGVLGLGLILAFCVMLGIRIIKLIYTDNPMPVKILALTLVGVFSYNMLEVSLFVAADLLSFASYIIGGAVLAYSYENSASATNR